MSENRKQNRSESFACRGLAADVKERMFEARRENLDEVISFIEEKLRQWECPARVMIQLDVAVEELFVNISDYAYGEKHGNVAVRIGLYPDGTAEITFRDNGVPFDPLKKQDPDITKSAEEREIGGLGIYLVKKSMDDVQYRYENGRNIVTIRKKIRTDMVE